MCNCAQGFLRCQLCTGFSLICNCAQGFLRCQLCTGFSLMSNCPSKGHSEDDFYALLDALHKLMSGARESKFYPGWSWNWLQNCSDSLATKAHSLVENNALIHTQQPYTVNMFRTPLPHSVLFPKVLDMVLTTKQHSDWSRLRRT